MKILHFKNKTNQTTIEHLFINLDFDNQNLNFNNYFLNLKKELIKLKNNYRLVTKTIYIATNDSIFLTNEQLEVILSLINKEINNNLIEYSFEIGYQTLTKEQLLILKKFNINRLVWKIRTFNNYLLQKINKNFNSDEIIILIKESLNLGFNNCSFDLEDNLLLQTKDNLIDDLNLVLSFNPSHISYQSHTDYHNSVNKKLIAKTLQQYNYDNYEFFSFALNQNYYCQQTLAYLQLKNWYGLGPNSASFIASKKHVVSINNTNEINWKSKVQKLNHKEYYQVLITQGLLLRTGLLLKDDKLLAFNYFSESITKLIETNKLAIQDHHLQATDQGWNLLNKILIDIINI